MAICLLTCSIELLEDLLTGTGLHVQKNSGFHLQLLDRKEVAYMIVFKIDRREVAYMIVFKNSFPPQQMLSIEHSSHRSHYCKPRNLPILTKNCSEIQHHTSTILPCCSVHALAPREHCRTRHCAPHPAQSVG